MIEPNLFYQSLISAVLSSGILLFIGRAVIREAIKDDLKKLEERMDRIEKDYVPCDYCEAQTNHNTTLLQSIDSKVEMLLEHQMK